MAVLSILVLGLFPSLVVTQQKAVDPNSERFVKEAQEIGGLVGHSTKTVVLTYAYGKPLMYHGEFAGVSWPLSGDLRLERLMGAPERSAEERFQEMSDYSPEYFVVTDFQEFGAQGDLRNLLTSRFAVRAQNSGYLIFDLKKRIDVAKVLPRGSSLPIGEVEWLRGLTIAPRGGRIPGKSAAPLDGPSKWAALVTPVAARDRPSWDVT